MPSGRRPNFERRERIFELRAEGMSYVQIARVVGVTSECVRQTVNPKPRLRSMCVRCRACGGQINPAGAVPRDDGDVLCLPCISRRPDVPFGEYLKAFRLEAGLKIVDLSRKVGLKANVITSYEHGRVGAPSWQNLVRLFQALGVQLHMNHGPESLPVAPADDSFEDKIDAPWDNEPLLVGSAV
jgi:transcriptional regulator with XRE-family HTH domain